MALSALFTITKFTKTRVRALPLTPTSVLGMLKLSFPVVSCSQCKFILHLLINSLSTLYCADDAHGGTPKIKMVMEDYNQATFSYVVVDYQGYPRYSHLKFQARFLPGPSPNTTFLKWLIDYSPLTDKTPPPDHVMALNLPLARFEDLAAHLEAEKSGNQRFIL